MKQVLSLCICVTIAIISFAQNMEKQAPQGFNSFDTWYAKGMES